MIGASSRRSFRLPLWDVGDPSDNVSVLCRSERSGLPIIWLGFFVVSDAVNATGLSEHLHGFTISCYCRNRLVGVLEYSGVVLGRARGNRV